MSRVFVTCFRPVTHPCLYFYVGAIVIGLVLALALWGLHTTTRTEGAPA